MSKDNFENDVIEFKSDKQYFELECDGSKPGTARVIDLNDVRFTKLAAMAESKKYGRVRIVMTGKPQYFFERKITNYTVFNNNIGLISWNPHKSRFEELKRELYKKRILTNEFTYLDYFEATAIIKKIIGNNQE